MKSLVPTVFRYEHPFEVFDPRAICRERLQEDFARRRATLCLLVHLPASPFQPTSMHNASEPKLFHSVGCACRSPGFAAICVHSRRQYSAHHERCYPHPTRCCAALPPKTKVKTRQSEVLWVMLTSIRGSSWLAASRLLMRPQSVPLKPSKTVKVGRNRTLARFFNRSSLYSPCGWLIDRYTCHRTSTSTSSIYIYINNIYFLQI